ncbi:hypothetical protein Hypma_006130 [Hypsizygus marmoreus]|uniref:Uncharacterized protein n=1 Tax=Hypsizygus marmoreus TaxID=39966 RepID=A0A369JXV1_HYPMA|nr:hypothetical protein Hypma_006130 [Hypsizygus marmoreus]
MQMPSDPNSRDSGTKTAAIDSENKKFKTENRTTLYLTLRQLRQLKMDSHYDIQRPVRKICFRSTYRLINIPAAKLQDISNDRIQMTAKSGHAIQLSNMNVDDFHVTEFNYPKCGVWLSLAIPSRRWRKVLFDFKELYATSNFLHCPLANTSLIHDAPQDQPVDFGPMVDPNGMLATMQGEGFVHSAENKVEYMGMSVNVDTNKVRYINIDPSKIRIGDIVEVQISFVCIPIKDGFFKLMNILRAITLLDQSHRDVSNMLTSRKQWLTYYLGWTLSRIQGGIHVNKVFKTIKRKALYTEEDEIEETGGKLSKMRID